MMGYNCKFQRVGKARGVEKCEEIFKNIPWFNPPKKELGRRNARSQARSSLNQCKYSMLRRTGRVPAEALKGHNERRAVRQCTSANGVVATTSSAATPPAHINIKYAKYMNWMCLGVLIDRMPERGECRGMTHRMSTRSAADTARATHRLLGSECFAVRDSAIIIPVFPECDLEEARV